MNMVTVKINGVEYKLKGDENEEYLHKVAGYVDRKIRAIIGSNNKLSTTAASVLSAVNIVDDLFKSDNAYSELVKKVDELEIQEQVLSRKIEALEKQLEEMKSVNDELRSQKTSVDSSEAIMAKEIEIDNLGKEVIALHQSTKKHIDENKILKEDNKDLKFELRSAKYKIIELQNKMIENNIDLAKAKSLGNPLIRNEKK